MMTGRWLLMAMIGGTLAFNARAEGAKGDDGDSNKDAPVEQLDLGTHDVLERLKLLRVQMAVDREEVAALELRIQRLTLEHEFAALTTGATTTDAKGVKKPAKPPSDPASDILVKAISLKPKKEAIVLYRGRVFNVRPGDSLGDLQIKDITESGLQVVRANRGNNVKVGR